MKQNDTFCVIFLYYKGRLSGGKGHTALRHLSLLYNKKHSNFKGFTSLRPLKFCVFSHLHTIGEREQRAENPQQRGETIPLEPSPSVGEEQQSYASVKANAFVTFPLNDYRPRRF